MLQPFPSHPVEQFLRHYQVSIHPRGGFTITLGLDIDLSVEPINTDIETFHNRRLSFQSLAKLILRWMELKFEPQRLRNWSVLSVRAYLSESLDFIGFQ